MKKKKTGTRSRVSLKDPQKLLCQNVAELKRHGISRDFWPWMIASHKSYKQSISYARVIDTSMTHKRNNYFLFSTFLQYLHMSLTFM